MLIYIPLVGNGVQQQREGGGRSIGHGMVLEQQINRGENHSAVLLWHGA
jgi:hypothetical protein